MYLEPFKSKDGWRWRLRSDGNHKILASSEAYSSWRKCWHTVAKMARQHKIPVNPKLVWRTAGKVKTTTFKGVPIIWRKIR